MKAWQIDRLGGQLRLNDIPVPEVRPGSVLVRVEAQSLMSYLKDYVEGKLPVYRAPEAEFIPGGNADDLLEQFALELLIGAHEWKSIKTVELRVTRGGPGRPSAFCIPEATTSGGS